MLGNGKSSPWLYVARTVFLFRIVIKDTQNVPCEACISVCLIGNVLWRLKTSANWESCYDDPASSAKDCGDMTDCIF